ncbi:hypothetical protein BGZ49_010556 [Haplosporangium sp. Z 27]|nr:hypothetical protein BGZ49_010556 [Haplosporangium sp. Z 27]
MNEPNGSRSVDYYSGISPNVGPGVGLGLGPARYGDREDWRGRVNQFSREFERDRDFRNRDIRQDIRDMRDSRPPRDPRDIRDMRDTPFRERDMRDRDMAYQRGPDHRDRDPRDRDLRELGITTRELRDKDNRDRDLRERGSWSSDAKGRDNFPGREAPDLDVRELVERERERERERDWERGDRNRERPIRLRDQDKDLDGNIPTRPALDHINRERERERERLSNSRSMTRVQDLDRDLLAYTSDKPRQTFGKEDDGADRDMVKSINFLNSSSLNTQRELKQQDGDDIQDRERARDRDRLHQREDVKDSFGREREFHNRHDGAGLRSDVDNRQRNTIVGRRPRILSAPGLNDFSHGEILGTQLRNFHDRTSNPTSPVAVDESPSGRIERIEKQDDRGLIGKLELPLVPSTTDVLSSTNQDQQSFENTKQATGQRNNTVVQDTVHLVSESGHANESPAKESIADSTAAISDNTSDGSMKQDLSKNSSLTKLFQGANDSTTLVVQLNTNNTQERSDADIPSDANGRVSVLQEVSDANSISSNRIDNPVQSKNVSDSASSNGVYVAKDSSAVKAAQSPSMTSLPSPRVSPIHEAIVVELPKDTDEFESHNDILKRIDTIDVQIQHVEDLILKRRQQKLHHEEEIQLTDHPGSAQDEDMNIDIEQPDSESVAEETAMDVDEKFTPLPEETAHDDLRNGDLLMNGGVAPSPVELVPDKDTEDTRLETIDSEDTDMMASDAEIRKDRRRQIIQQFSRQELHNPIDEDDPFFKRKEQQKRRPQLYDQIYAENNTRAKKYGRVHSALGSSREHGHSHQQNEQSKPQIYESVEDYPFYQENIENHLRLRNALLHNMATKAAELDEKELELKREYKHHWEAWIKKVEKLDKIKEKMSNAPLPANVREEDLVQSDNVLFTTRNRRGAYNSDAVRSEAELMEIIQSLENADMRNPDLRASRTAATVPPMILDPNIREKVHYYDRNHLVTDPAKYYRLGPVTDIWTEEEREIFIKRYLNYPKQFGKIAAGIENKTASQCVLFYYREKKKIGFKDMVSNRGRKRKPAAGKRKEKVVQQSSPSGQPGKKHKGSALIEDIGQANRKMAKSKEVRGLHDLHQNWADFDGEPITRRRVRSTVLGQQNSTPTLDETNSNVASPVPSAVSTPVNAAGERRKQRSKATNTRSSTAAASNKTVTEDVVTEEKKSKTENVTPASAITATTNVKSTSKGDTIVSVESSKVSAASSKQSHAMVLETIEESATTTTVVTPPSGGVTRWTAAEQEKFKAALKKHGRNFEAVAIAVGTKTVDQCKNFRFNYRRKYGVSALDDANNHDTTVFDDEKEDKEMSSAGADKSKTKKGKATSSAITSTPNTPQSATANVNKDTVATPSGRRKSGKPPAQETVKEDSTKELSTQSNDNEELESIADKRRRKRAVSKSEAGGNSAESIQSATSFRARYSRDLSEASSPSISATSQMEDQFSGQSNVDGSVRRSNFSSYWSRQEKIDFTRLISLHGKDWEKISKAMKTKTLIQVRNYYSHNAEKLAAEGIVGGDILGSLPPTYKEDEGTLLENRSDQQINEGDHADQDIADDEDHGSTECPSTEAGSKSSHFNPSNLGDDKDDSKLEETPQSVTPPRRITNIGNLLNNDDEDVNVAVEDWFGNDEDGSNAQSPEQPFEVVQGSTQNQRQRYSNEPSHFGEEDIDTEDDQVLVITHLCLSKDLISPSHRVMGMCNRHPMCHMDMLSIMVRNTLVQ